MNNIDKYSIFRFCRYCRHAEAEHRREPNIEGLHPCYARDNSRRWADQCDDFVLDNVKYLEARYLADTIHE